VDERPGARTASDQREPALADHLELSATEVEARALAVQGPVAQGDTLDPIGLQHGLLHVPDGVEGGARRRQRRWVQRIVLGLDAASAAGERPTGVALGDEPADAGRPTGRQQMIETFRSQSIGHGERPLEVTHFDFAEIRQLVDDDLRLETGHHLGDLRRIEHVGE
jgi:hypothetical protein